MRRVGATLVAAVLTTAGLAGLAPAAHAATNTSSDGVVTITVPDVQALPQIGYKNYPYTVVVANLAPGTAWTMNLYMTKVGGASKGINPVSGSGSGTVPSAFTSRTVHTKTDPVNGAGRYIWTATLTQTVSQTVSSAHVETTFIAPSRVSITRAPAAVHPGQQYSFAGQVTYFRSATNTFYPTGVVHLVLQWRANGSTTWTNAGTTTTNSIGQFTVAKYGAVSGTWNVFYAGTSSVAASSHTVAVTVS